MVVAGVDGVNILACRRRGRLPPTVTPGRDPDKPLVETPENAGHWTKAGLWLFRTYLGIAAVLAVAAGVLWLALALAS